jgi:hypothetical protein
MNNGSESSCGEGFPWGALRAAPEVFTEGLEDRESSFCVWSPLLCGLGDLL